MLAMKILTGMVAGDRRAPT